MNRRELETRLSAVTSALLREKGSISFPDLFLSLGYLDQKDLQDWRFRRVPYPGASDPNQCLASVSS